MGTYGLFFFCNVIKISEKGHGVENTKSEYLSEISHAKIINQFALVLSCHDNIEYWSYRSSLEASSSIKKTFLKVSLNYRETSSPESLF